MGTLKKPKQEQTFKLARQQTLKKPKQTLKLARQQTLKKPKQTLRRSECGLRLVTLPAEDLLRRSSSIHSDHESFFSHQYFGGDDLPELADTSLPVYFYADSVPTRDPPLLLSCSSTPTLISARLSLTVCQVANEVYDDALDVTSTCAIDSYFNQEGYYI